MLKEAASRGQSERVRVFLEAGVPLKPLPAPKGNEQDNYQVWLKQASMRDC